MVPQKKDQCPRNKKRNMAEADPGPSMEGWLKGVEIIAGSLEAAYSLNWGAQKIWGKGGGETLALL